MSPSEFFMCHKYSCLMRIEACIKRQQMAAITDKDKLPGHYKVWGGKMRNAQCDKCEQGKENVKLTTAKSLKKDASVSMLADKLIKAAEEKNVVMKQCRRCKQILPADQFYKRKDRGTGGGLDSLCRPCKLASNKEYRARQKAAKAKPMPAPVTHVPHTEVGPHMVHLDFAEYPELLARIKSVAMDEMRGVDMQIMFFLRQHMPDKTEA